MCDTFVALPPVTRSHSVLFAKSADCEVNEANAIVRIPRKKHVKGEAVRLTHLVIPQVEETFELFLTKAFWTYGCEIGVNEYGLAMGEEAVFTTQMAEDKDGIIGPDLMRLGLERARTCREAIEVMTALLEQYGQGGSAELKGNSHFDSSFLMSDAAEAYILETAGRNWAVRKIEEIGSISNMLGIRTDWTACSLPSGTERLDWAGTYGLPEVPANLGAPDRQSITFSSLQAGKGELTTQSHVRSDAPAWRWLPSCPGARSPQRVHARRAAGEPLVAGGWRDGQRGRLAWRDGLGDRHIGQLRIDLQAGLSGGRAARPGSVPRHAF